MKRCVLFSGYLLPDYGKEYRESQLSNIYTIGSLYPVKPDGSPNIVLSSSYQLEEEGGQFFWSVRKMKVVVN